MRVLTPTSNEKIGHYIRVIDILSVLLAAPVAIALRDTDLFAGSHFGSTLFYCSIGFVAGMVTLIVLHLGKDLSDYISMREVQYVAAVSITTTTVASFLVFTFNRLDLVPRSVPPIHFLVLMSLMLAGRVIASKRRDMSVKELSSNGQHTLIVGVNKLAWFYLRMLDSFNVEQTNIAAILDDNPKLLGRSIFGHTVVAPPSDLRRVIAEYRVHGVHIDRVLISANRPANELSPWSDLEEYCQESKILVEFLGDILGLKFEGSEPADPVAAPAWPARNYFILKRFLDFSFSLAALGVFLPVLFAVALGVLVDLGWPAMFWQKRVGRGGRPFLIYKFRTLHAPFDRRGRFVAEDQRESRFGRFLSRTRLNELPQLWNVLVGEMSFVGPRPLLPVDQPSTSKLRLQIRPGLTGWAQIHGGKLVGADEKGVLDDWYVDNISLWLDALIILRTVSLVVFGDQSTSTAARRLQSRVSSEAGLGRDLKHLSS